MLTIIQVTDWFPFTFYIKKFTDFEVYTQQSSESVWTLFTPSKKHHTEKREPKWQSWESHLVVRNSALCGAPFFCHPLWDSRFRAVQVQNGSPSEKRAALAEITLPYKKSQFSKGCGLGSRSWVPMGQMIFPCPHNEPRSSINHVVEW